MQGKDIASARLVCKDVCAAATDVLFERHGLILWIGGGTVYVPESTLQLCKRPDLAALVKSLWITLAIHDPERELDDEESYEWPYSNWQLDIEKLIDKSGTTLRSSHAHWYILVDLLKQY
jgi:hypothetical protein